MHATFDQLPKASIGIEGLDEILRGGLARSRLHLLEGTPGTGKTTVALQFLLEGARPGTHEDTIREFRIGQDGIRLGEPLHDFQGILRGIPTYLGKAGVAEGQPITGSTP